MVKLELRVEYTAHEITAEDFDYSDPTLSTRIDGLVYRDETRTVRLMTETEQEDEAYGEKCDRRAAGEYKRATKATGPAPPGPCSYYGIGCWIVCKNGRPLAIMSREKLAEVYRIAP